MELLSDLRRTLGLHGTQFKKHLSVLTQSSLSGQLTLFPNVYLVLSNVIPQLLSTYVKH